MPSIALVELPALKLVDEANLNWTALRQHEPLGSKQIVAAMLEHAGFDVAIVNLKAAADETAFGTVSWRSRTLTKVAVGTVFSVLDPVEFDVWALPLIICKSASLQSL